MQAYCFLVVYSLEYFFCVQLQVEDLARLSFQTTPIYVDVDDGRKKVMPPISIMIHDLWNLFFQHYHSIWQWHNPNLCRSQLKDWSRAMSLFPVPIVLFFYIYSWRDLNQRKWWSFSLHATLSSSMQIFSSAPDLTVWIFMENKSSTPGQLPSSTSVKLKKGSCSVLMLLLVDSTYLMWYVNFSF